MAATRLVRITHPFHPLSGQQLACVGERSNASGKRLLLQVEDGTICAVLRQWTDLVPPDPEIILGQHHALFRVADLLELARLVDRLGRGEAGNQPESVSGELCRKCKWKNAAAASSYEEESIESKRNNNVYLGQST